MDEIKEAADTTKAHAQKAQKHAAAAKSHAVASANAATPQERTAHAQAAVQHAAVASSHAQAAHIAATHHEAIATPFDGPAATRDRANTAIQHASEAMSQATVAARATGIPAPRPAPPNPALLGRPAPPNPALLGRLAPPNPAFLRGGLFHPPPPIAPAAPWGSARAFVDPMGIPAPSAPGWGGSPPQGGWPGDQGQGQGMPGGQPVPSSPRDIANAGKKIQGLLFNPQTYGQGVFTLRDLVGQAHGDGRGPQDVAVAKLQWLQSAVASLQQNGDPHGAVLARALRESGWRA